MGRPEAGGDPPQSGMKVIIEAGVQVSIKARVVSSTLAPSGVTIQGTMVAVQFGRLRPARERIESIRS